MKNMQPMPPSRQVVWREFFPHFGAWADFFLILSLTREKSGWFLAFSGRPGSS